MVEQFYIGFPCGIILIELSGLLLLILSVNSVLQFKMLFFLAIPPKERS